MKYKLIETVVNVKTHAIQQSIKICNSEEEIEEYWKEISSKYILLGGVGDKIGNSEYFIQSGKVKDSECLVTIMQYTLNYLP